MSFEAIILTASGWLVSAFLAYRLNRRSKRQDRHDDIAQQSSERRRKFREDIRLIKHRVEPVDWRKFQETWQSTLPEFEAACIRIEDDIQSDQREHFATARDRYINRKQADGNYPAGMAYHEFQNIDVTKLFERQREMKRILTPILDEIIRYAD